MTLHEKYRSHGIEELHDAVRALNHELEGYTETVDGTRKVKPEHADRANELRAELDYLFDAIRIASPRAQAETSGLGLLTANGGSSSDNYLNARIFPPGSKRDYNSLFNPEGRTLDDGGFKNLEDFQNAIMRAGQGYSDNRLTAMDKKNREIRMAMTEGTPSEGGFLVPEAFGALIWAEVLEESVIMPRATIRPMVQPEEHIPLWTIGDHSSNVYGGITASWTAEAGTITGAEPTVRRITLKAKKLTELAIPSNELVTDTPNFDGDLSSAMTEALKWYLDYYFLNGTGAGQPQGIYNANCRVQVTKETGQTAATIQYANLTKMYARQKNKRSSAWITNEDTMPQLLELSIPVGTGGSAYQVMRETTGGFSIFGRPVLFTEKAPTLGGQDDIVLADLSQYLIGIMGGIQMAKSIHVYFTTDRSAYRFIVRVDGQSMWDEALTPKTSSDTLSPIVGLQARA